MDVGEVAWLVLFVCFHVPFKNQLYSIMLKNIVSLILLRSIRMHFEWVY